MQLKDSPFNLSPLSDEQQRQLGQVLSTLNTQQLAWVSGYLYGLSQSGQQNVAASAAVAAPSGSLTTTKVAVMPESLWPGTAQNTS